MKAVMGIGILQLVVTGFLLSKIVSLETNLDEVKSKLSSNAQQRAFVPDVAAALASSEHEADSALSINDIRDAVRAELDGALSHIQESPLKVKPRESDPVLISEFESRIDYYLSDGAFSRVDLLDVENQLAKLEPDDRRRMMNKLTQAMNKANIQMFK